MTITIKMIKEWVHLYTTTDMSTYDIADKYNVSTCTVRKYLLDNGVKLYHKHRPSKKYYKDKYIIALYDLDGNLYRMFDNVYELSKFLNKSINLTHSCVSPRSIDKKLRINGKWYRKVLVEVC